MHVPARSGRRSCRRSRSGAASVTATAICGSLDRRVGDEPDLVELAGRQREVGAVLRRAGLAGDRDARERGRRAGAVAGPRSPSSGRPRAPSTASSRRCRARGATVCTTWPSALTISLVRCGAIRRPPLATAAATIAICSGVTSSPPSPMPTRPTSAPAGERQVAGVAGIAHAARRQLVGGQVDRRRASRSRAAPCSAGASAAPTFSATCAHTVLIELVSA